MDLTNEKHPTGILSVYNVLQPGDIHPHSREGYARSKIQALSMDKDLIHLRIKVDGCRGVRTLHAQPSLRLRDADLPSYAEGVASRQSCSDVFENPLDAHPDVVDWLIWDVRQAAGETDKTILWDEAFIDSRIALLKKGHLHL